VDFRPLLISLQTATAAIVFTFFLGILAARWVVNLRQKALKTIIDGLFTLPLILPPTVAGFVLLFLFGTQGPIGGALLELFAVRLVFSWPATVLAAVVISFPLMYRAARGAFEQVDESLVLAARTLGLGEWRIFWHVTLPTTLPGVLAGAVLAFARGLGEFGATIMIAGNIAGQTRTLPLAVYAATMSGDMGLAAAYVAIMVVMALVIIWAMNYFAARGRRG